MVVTQTDCRRQWKNVQVKINRKDIFAAAYQSQKMRNIALFSDLEHRIEGAPSREPRSDVLTALATIKLGSACALNTGRSFSALGCCVIDFRRVNIIAYAMYHETYIG